EGYKRAHEIANSPNVGICLCCGTWLEGGRKLTGKDPEEMIRYFGAAKIWKIHFRNVSAPLPHFVETFMDNGYYDMWKIMKALRDVILDAIWFLNNARPRLAATTRRPRNASRTWRPCSTPPTPERRAERSFLLLVTLT